MRRKIHGYSIWRWRLGILLVLGIVLFLGVTKFQEVLAPPEGNEYTSFPDQIPASKPKIAFLFLARNSMPLDFLWAHFFKVVRYFENVFARIPVLLESAEIESLVLLVVMGFINIFVARKLI